MLNLKGTIFLLALAVIPTSVLAEKPREVSVGWEEGLKPPYLMLDQSNRPIGIAVELVNEIFQRSQIQVINVVKPWKRCLEDVKANRLAVVPNSSYTAERAEYAFYTEPLYETHLVLFYDKKRFPVTPVVKTIDELAGYKVLGVLGFNYDRYENKVSMDNTALDRELLMKKLLKGRGDFAAEQREVILFLQKEGKVDLGGVGYIPDPAKAVQTFYILVSKQHPQAQEITNLLNAGISEVKRDGTYKKTVARYLGTQP